MSSDDRLADIGRGVAQLHTRLGRVLDTLQELPQASPQASGSDGGEALEALLDLIEATQKAVEAPDPAPKRGWWSRGRGIQPSSADQGLRLALDGAREKLRRMGIEPSPVEGKLDPELHRAVEVLPAPDSGRAGQLAQTFRLGWHRRIGAGREVVRTAQVSVYGAPQ